MPTNTKKGVFTTACVDNIDHCSRTAKESFHGTAISITQHLENSKDGIKDQLLLSIAAIIILGLFDNYQHHTQLYIHLC